MIPNPSSVDQDSWSTMNNPTTVSVSSPSINQKRTRRKKLTALGSVFIIFLCMHMLNPVESARGPESHVGVDRECNVIGNLVKAKGFSYPWWKVDSITSRGGIPSGGVAGVCPMGKTGARNAKCCKELNSPVQRNEMTAAFSEKWLGPKLSTNGDVFKDRKKKFDVTFKDLLTRAHAAFHAMFERTYGMLYIQHAPIFHALFTTLEAYYDTGRDSLEGKLNEFFAILTRKMFEVLNAQYEFDEAYLSCATIVISEKQGGDLHRQIVSSLRRSFVATRALAQGLNDADRVFTNLQKLKVEPNCISSLSTMLQCPICSEQRAYKPCMPFCTSITSKCLMSVMPLSKPWTEFTSALEAILDRLLGPYNVEAVVEPIHIKISEAIMNFQESGPDLSQAVFSKCGKPKLKSARNKRDAVIPLPLAKTSLNSDRSMQSDGFRTSGTPNSQDDMQPSKSLEKLLREIKNKVKKSKSVWDVLPRQVCHGISKDYSSQLCWNGTSLIKPDRNKSSEESETGIDSSPKGVHNPLVTEQLLILMQITEKLRASFNGLDVQWIQETEELDFEGSGTGSGSGEIPTDLEDSDDDDPSGQINPVKNKPSPPWNFNQPSHPKFPVRPPPTILNPVTNHEDEEEDDDDDDDRNNNDNQVDWNSVFKNKNEHPRISIGGDGIDFAPSPPDFNKPPPPPPIFSPPQTTPTTTSTTSTTRRPQIDIRKPPLTTTSSGSMDDTSKAIAFFKLFSPIFASMIGKAFSFK